MSKKTSFLVVRVADSLKDAMQEESDLLNMSLSQYTREVLEHRMDVISKIDG